VVPFASTGTHTSEDTISAFAGAHDGSVHDGSELSATSG
jgi:hypothetical protein